MGYVGRTQLHSQGLGWNSGGVLQVRIEGSAGLGKQGAEDQD